jgi:hypothetical protein
VQHQKKLHLSLLKTVNYRESLGIFLCDRRTVGRHDHHSVCSRFRALVPVSQPSVAGTRACRPATSADRLAAATPSPAPSSFRRSAPVGVPLPSVAAGPRRLGTRQTGDSGQLSSILNFISDFKYMASRFYNQKPHVLQSRAPR